MPAPLADGPVGAFWTPAALGGVHGLAGGAEFVQTPDVVSLRGVVVGLARGVAGRFAVGLQAGRVGVDDLTRTISSPTSEAGEIPVYEQFAGVGIGARLGFVQLGLLTRFHGSRFDTRADDGVTIDFGFKVRPVPRLTMAGASRFAPIGFASHFTADYALAAEYAVRTADLWGSRALVIGRYGLAYRPAGRLVEHALGAGLALEDRFRVDVAWIREQGFGVASWRPVVGVGLRAGRYAVSLARGSGLNDLGATFRIGLDAQLLR